MLLVVLLAQLLGSALFVTPVYAAGITVTTTVDELNSNGNCSLREAIQAANTNFTVDACTAGTGAHTITLPAGTYTLTITGAGEDFNATGDLDVYGVLTINGAGAGTTIIRAGATPGSGIDRVFDVLGTNTLNLSGVTIANGKCPSTCRGAGARNAGNLTVTDSTFSGGTADFGGGIYNTPAGILTVTNSAFSGNAAAYGGGIENDGGTLTVTNSTFLGNSGQYGSGVYNGGILTVTGSTFAGNTASVSAGGIYNDAGGAALTVTNSTFSGNSAANTGGGIINYGTVTGTDSTFSGNSASYGGGIFNAGTLTLKNSTFSGNSATGLNGGGGIYNSGSAISLNFENTILADSASGYDCYNVAGDTIATDINNLIETNGPSGNMCGTPAVTGDPGLGALANNGGATQTFAITATSPAYNAGDNAACAPADQRGVTRPQNGTCDIGAFELNTQSGPTFAVNTTEDSSDGSCDAYAAGATDCTLREAISAANNLAGADTITVPAGIYTLALAGTGEDLNATGDLDITDSLTINGAGAATTIIRAGATPTSGIDRVLDILAVIPVDISGVTIANGKCPSPCNGGGILNNGGTLSVTNSAFSGNSATSNGGAIYNYSGALNVTNSTFSGNSADFGGGIDNLDALAVTNSTFSGNSAASNGGGILNTATLSATNSTFSGNSAASNGGGIGNYGTLNLKNTLLANSAAGGDCYNGSGDAIATNLDNLIETNGSAGHMCGTPAVAGDPGLGALADNGGGTQTFAITATSPAYNAGDNPTCTAAPVNGLDQRGIVRPQFGICDIGSYEFPDTVAPGVVSSTRVNANPTNLASVDFAVTFSESVTGVDTSDFSLVTSGVTGASITGVSGSGAVRTVTVNTGSGTGTIRLDVPAGASITDLTANSLAGLPYVGGQAYDIDKIAPVVVSSLRVNPNPSAAASVDFIVTFSKSVTGVDVSDFALNTSGVTGASITGLTGSGATRTVTVNTGSGNGTIRLDVLNDNSIQDGLGHPLSGAFSGGETYTIDKSVSLTLTSNRAQDGWVLETSERSGLGGTFNALATSFKLGDDAARKQYRGILSFSTGPGLPDNAVITGVTLKVMKQGISGGGDPLAMFQGFMVDVQRGFFGKAALQAADFKTKANGTYGPFMPVLVGNWYSIDLTSANGLINKLSTKSGLTQIRLRFKLDDNNNSVANTLSLFSGNAPAANRPTLVIEYYVP